MSGERISLAGDADGNTARLVRVASRLAEVNLGPYALVGGLAVMCRLAAVHRATQDVDAVIETTSPTAIDLITSSIGDADPANRSRVLIDGVKVDIIDTAAFRYDDLEGIDIGDRLFVVGHRWALDTATRIEIVVADATAAIRVAPPLALVATKSAALLGGRRNEPHKRASDLYDIYRLTVEYDRVGGVAGALLAAPFGLGNLVGEALGSLVVDQPERAARWLFDGGAEMRSVTPDDLRDVIGPLVERLLR